MSPSSSPKFRGCLLRRQRKTRIRERRGAVTSSQSLLRTKRPCSLLEDAMTAVNEIKHEEQSRLRTHDIIPDDSDDEEDQPIGFIGTKRHRRNSCLSSFSAESHTTKTTKHDSITSSVVSSLTQLQIQSPCEPDARDCQQPPPTTDSPNSSTRRVSDDDLQQSQQKAAQSTRRLGWIQKLR
uniref:Uncharacterized protein n=1 Tax=Helicotheca tamesis TaxID=374047 RepID=A0A7S2MIZ9_9STRA